MADGKRRAELSTEELAKRKGGREEMRAALEREAEAGLKLQLQQKDFEWRQKYQVQILGGLKSCKKLRSSRVFMAALSCGPLLGGWKNLSCFGQTKHQTTAN